MREYEYTSRDRLTGEPYHTDKPFEPAVDYGRKSRKSNLEARWEDVESDLEYGWERLKEETKLTWQQARDAVREGWSQLDHTVDRVLGTEDDYWRENYADRDYVAAGTSYETYRPAYQYGVRQRFERPESRWEDIESDLEYGWERVKEESELTWEQAKRAAFDGWNRIEKMLPGDFDGDGR